MARLNWNNIIQIAERIVLSYDTGVTLRQLFYRLVATEVIPNKKSAYSRLSSVTAIARREGWFPDLIDNTRGIRRAPSWPSAAKAIESLENQFRFDRTWDQEYSVYVAVEKNALAALINSWFSERGIPVLAFGGYPSQTFVDRIKSDINYYDRPAVLIYGGDFDATGVDILRDFVRRTTDSWEDVFRIALNEPQIAEFNLPPLPGKHWDPRAAAFEEKYGRLIQVELDALPPDELKRIYDDAVGEFWDDSPYQEILKEEDAERRKIFHPNRIAAILEVLNQDVGFMESGSDNIQDLLIESREATKDDFHSLAQDTYNKLINRATQVSDFTKQYDDIF